MLNHWSDGRFHLLVTNDILDEYLRVLDDIGYSDADLVSNWTDHICKFSLIVLKTIKIDLCRDSSDNKFLECAISGDADCIVSGDEDLLILKAIHKIPILKPAQFLMKFF